MILFVQDRDGDENYNVYAVDPAAKPEAGQGRSPGAEPDGRQGSPRVHLRRAEEVPDTIHVGLNDRDGRLARRLQGQPLDREARASSGRTPTGSPAGSST